MYYLIILLQGYCVFHVYKNRNDYYWFFLILFLPVIGSVIYLITQVYNKRDADKITKEIGAVINPTKKIRTLESKLRFSDTFQNRIDLADAYFEIKDYSNAIKQYGVALKDDQQDSFYVIKQLIVSYYEMGNYEEVIKNTEKIKSHNEFKKSKMQFIYGLALEQQGDLKNAEINLLNIDSRYSNYEERLGLAEFLFRHGKGDDAIVVLKEIKTESLHMTKPNKRKYRSTINKVNALLKEHNVSS